MSGEFLGTEVEIGCSVITGEEVVAVDWLRADNKAMNIPLIMIVDIFSSVKINMSQTLHLDIFQDSNLFLRYSVEES